MTTRPKYQAVIFDLFGTLVGDAQDPIYDRMAGLLNLKSDLFLDIWGRGYERRTRGQATFEDSLSELCRQAGLPLDGSLIADVASIRFSELERSLQAVKPGAVHTLQTLSELGVRVGLVSNASLEVPELWPSCQLAAYFEAPVFSCNIGIMKPQPEVYLMACQQAGVEPERCLFVGDGGDDELTGAVAVGMTPVQVRSHRSPAAGVQFLVDSIEQVLRLL